MLPLICAGGNPALLLVAPLADSPRNVEGQGLGQSTGDEVYQPGCFSPAARLRRKRRRLAGWELPRSGWEASRGIWGSVQF